MLLKIDMPPKASLMSDVTVVKMFSFYTLAFAGRNLFFWKLFTWAEDQSSRGCSQYGQWI